MNALSPEKRNFFTDISICREPYQYFSDMLKIGPVVEMKSPDALMVTGYDECIEVLRNHKDFSSYNSSVGAGYPLPFTPEGDDISEQMEAHKSEMPHGDLLVNQDGMRHSELRSLMNPLFTPSRLKANEAFIKEYAAEVVKQAVEKGHGEMVNEISTPFVTMVVADLLGVPTEDRAKFRAVIDSAPRPGSMTENSNTEEFTGPLEYMARFFAEYIIDRRNTPKDDVLTKLATITYPDGNLPELKDLVTLAGTIFGAGQDTSAKLLSTSMRFLVENQELQSQLRSDPTLIPAFIEEVLRLEGPTKATFRLARRNTKIGDVEVPAGKRIVVALAAANRDPKRWENPHDFQMGRKRAQEHLSFSRGAHACAGAPLARAEIRMILEEFLAQTLRIEYSAEHHGLESERQVEYDASFFIRGLSSLHVNFIPA
ncbi:cytochrome P450 [Halioxenophilus sp. WMMB6]|uniref:cytochrome P450 n=1 Tax=Halioxenophilus sp. WMMB6 TaxID=3073815 RepID=UPI00295E908C|nr:cytochrome P450 [Halioxenophilus sp. WMMB6]